MSGDRRVTGLVNLAAAILVVAALYWAREVLVPFALAVVLSFLLGPVVVRLQRYRVHRVAAVVLTVLMVFGAMGLLGWVVYGQFRGLAAVLPQYRESIQAKVETARRAIEPSVKASKTVADLGAQLAPADQAVKSRDVTDVRVVEPPRDAVDVIHDVVSPMLGALLTAGMVIVFTFVMLLRRGDLRDRFIRLAGDGRILVTTQALDEAAQRVSSYLGRLLLVNGIYGTAMALGLWALGVPNALLWGALSGALRFIPYAGPWIAAAFPVLTSLATSESWSQPALVLGMIVVFELVTNLVLEPWIYGAGTGISPLALLVSTLFWTWLWGPVGLVLSTPFTVCLVVMGKHVPQLHFLYLLFSDSPGLPAPARLYQRLLAGEQDESWAIVEEALREHPLHEVYDAIVLPALTLAERDKMRGALDDDARLRVEESLGLLLDAAGETPAPSEGKPAGEGDAPAAPAPRPPPDPDLRVLVLPGEDAADALGALMAAQVLEREGLTVETGPAGELTSEIFERLERADAQVVCVSVVPPSRLRHVRYLCKRLAAGHPELPVVLGLWGLRPAEGGSVRPPLLEGATVARTLDEVREVVRHLAETVRSRQQAGLPGGVARPESVAPRA